MSEQEKHPPKEQLPSHIIEMLRLLNEYACEKEAEVLQTNGELDLALPEQEIEESEPLSPESEELDESFEELNKEPQETLPEQGPLVGKFVDVMEINGDRIGIGKCLREDFGPPWKNEVKIVIPPFQKGKVLENKRLTLCPCQQIED